MRCKTTRGVTEGGVTGGREKETGGSGRDVYSNTHIVAQRDIYTDIRWKQAAHTVSYPSNK